MSSPLPGAWIIPPHPACACVGARCDVIGTLRGIRTVVEIKTGSVQPTHWWQLGLQEKLAGAESGMVLSLDKGGQKFTTPTRPPWAADRAALWQQIEGAARIAQWRLAHDRTVQLSEDGPHALRRADGVRVPGIGTVLRLAGLVDLSRIPPAILANAAARGQMVHRYIEMMHDGAGGLDRDSIAPELAGYVASWELFLAETGFVVESVETPLVYDCRA